jgi:hypothetical protein
MVDVFLMWHYLTHTLFMLSSIIKYMVYKIFSNVHAYTWCVQVLRSPKEAFAVAMQLWRERFEKCVCLQGDYVEK